MESKVWLGLWALAVFFLSGSLWFGARPVSAHDCRADGVPSMSVFYSCAGDRQVNPVMADKPFIKEYFVNDKSRKALDWCVAQSSKRKDKCKDRVNRYGDDMVNFYNRAGVGNPSEQESPTAPLLDSTQAQSGTSLSLTEAAQRVADSLLEVCGGNCGVTDVNIDTLIVPMEDPPDIPHLPEPNWDADDEPEEYEIVLYEYNVPYGPIGPSMTFRIRADPLGGFFIEGLWVGADQFFTDRIMPEFIRFWGEETMWGMSLEPIGWRLHSFILNMN